jgi:glucose/arabinose dehydrogenase
MRPLRPFVTLVVCTLCGAAAAATDLPTGFSEVDIQRPDGAPVWDEAVGVTFSESGRMFVWERGGRVWIVDEEDPVTQPFLSVTEEVLAWRDHGMLGFALHPGFEQNGYVFVYYAVDLHHLYNCDSPADGAPDCNATYDSGVTWAPGDPSNPAYMRATIGRLVRYQAIKPLGDADYAQATQIDYSTRRVLIGETFMSEPKGTGVPLLYDSHGVGALVFSPDGTLLVSAGDGASYNDPDVGSAAETYYSAGLEDGVIKPKENVGALRAQLIDSLNGKILRIDPKTGDGIASNPFYDPAEPRAARSRVWARGFRNPFRIALRPDTGSHFAEDGNPGELLVADVGYNAVEEVSVLSDGGGNFGWPLFEGLETQPEYLAAAEDVANLDAPNPLFGVSGCTAQHFRFPELLEQDARSPGSFPNPCDSTVQVPASARPALHARPALDYGHWFPSSRWSAFGAGGESLALPLDTAAPDGSVVTGPQFRGTAITGGIWYRGDDFPEEYRNVYFFGDYGDQWIKYLVLDSSHGLQSVHDFATDAGGIVGFAAHESRGLFYIAWTAFVRKISYSPPGGAAPVAVAAASPSFGASPLTVEFSADGSHDPDGGPITYWWDFGDGASSSEANPQHTFVAESTDPQNFIVELTVRDETDLEASRTVRVFLNNTPPTIAITSPLDGSLYSMSGPTQVNLAANIDDSQTSREDLQCRWQQVLYHNHHEHSDPFIRACSTAVTISPLGCGGEAYSVGFRLLVSDPQGMTATAEARMFPDCKSVVDEQQPSLPEGTEPPSVSPDEQSPSVPSDEQPPSVPSNLTAMAVGTESIDLSWDESVDLGGSVVAGYQIFRDGLPVAITTTPRYSDTGLQAGTQYSYAVAAFDDVTPPNQSLLSASVAASTLDSPIPTPLKAVTRHSSPLREREP